ncbi:hypothetical protein ACS0TY_025179 [Phlomoides rotata]
MASDNLMTMEQPWVFRPTFADPWISDNYSKETDAFAMALQKSLSPASSDGGDAFSADLVESLFAQPEMARLQTPTPSGGSENETLPLKPRRTLPPPSGRVAKRKSRASKRATTTFINADPANFRQMVQQVTGVRFGGLNGQLLEAPVLKPEPQRAINQLYTAADLPTFDSSAFMLGGSGSSLVAQPPTPPSVLSDGRTRVAGLDFDSFCSFPTLESWKVM